MGKWKRFFLEDSMGAMLLGSIYGVIVTLVATYLYGYLCI